ncbi:hypothetical protein B9Z19DRAFT_971761 [Tuber borchii]|uniref:BTB domain-containing protein n=1 Tax=Tuber borchii TaxID=42251 RepID=A0A2T7A133_TUBBO|nr:hypothetical protein B9Z19DRAFT_971761 [Tuber borchii]
MALQSDRQTPISEEKNDRLGGLKWNNWIFKEGIVNLYLLFLRHLMKLHGTAGYRFWPTPPSELTNPDHVSSTISTEFWKKAGESSFDLYPQIPPLLSTPRRRQLQTSENLSIKKTIFNFLSTEQSKFIIPLLVQLGITNIATPPPTIVKGLTKATTDEVSLLLVTPVYVRDLLRNPTRCKLLQDHWKKDPGTLMRNINRLLSFLLKDTSEDCLTGCSLLPLEGGSWGTFSPNPISQIQYFASSTPLERSILEVAAGRLVSEGLGGIVIDGLLEKGMNISPLTFDHIASLCPLVESKNPEYRKAWLVNVWEYFRQRVTKDPDSRDKYLESIESLPLYCGSVVGEQDSLRFLTPLSFASGSLPAIVDPRTPFLERGKATLFQALNGLILVDKSTFPTINTSAESVEQPSGACCLVKAIGTLPFTVPTIHSLSQVFSSVPMEGIKALSELVLPHISDLLGRDPTIVSTLKQLPIWPVASSSSFQSAAMLKLAPHTTLSLITMIDQTTFLKPDLAFKHREDLRKLGVQQLSYLDFLNEEVGLARGYLPAENIREYQRCIEMVYKENPDVFRSCDLAVDGDLRFCRPSTLYDSSVPLFQAAFRDQQRSRFLHPELAMSHVWRDLLIKNVSGPTYIKCARSIERRNSQTIPDSQIESDACTVFDHLCYDDREMHSWSEWKSLLEIRFAPIQETTASWDQSRLKNQQREIFRQRNKLVAISEAVDPRMEGISWAVKPVLRKQMGSLAFSMITSKKLMVRPTTVIEHLEFLASHCEEITQNELQIRIPEIKEAYEHLEQNMHTYTIQESALIWLNVENEDLGKMTREIFRNSWSCSRNLCLNSNYDSGEIKRVRSFLGRFHSLLLHANVSAIIPPDSPAPVTPTTQSPILEGLLELRERELLFDITITAHKPAMLFQTLQIFKAHKIVLASVSDYWKTMLTSTFKESSTPEISLQDDPSTIKVLLDYIYTNKFVEPPHEDDVTRQLENLLDQLEKSEKWFLPSFKRSMENYLSDDHWIRPETVKSILRNARTCNADRLAHVCEKYIQNNRAIVEREAPKEEYESQGYGFRIF